MKIALNKLRILVLMSEQDPLVLSRLAEAAGTPYYLPKSRLAFDVKRSQARIRFIVVGLRAHVHVAVRHRRHRELRGLVNVIGRARVAAVQLRQAECVEGVKNSGAA